MRSRRRKAVFAALLVVGPLAAVEGGFSLYEASRAGRKPSIHEDDPLCGYRMKPHLEAEFDADGVDRRLTTNSLGHRGRDLAPDKPAGGYRIACLGGSTTFGYGATSDDATYPAVLERLLSAAAPGRRIEVFNAGVQGWNSRTSLDNFATRLANLRFDLVLIKHANNDLLETWSEAYRARSLRPPGEVPSRGPLDWLAGHSGFLRWAVRRAQRHALATKHDTFAPEGRAAFDRNLRALIAFVRATGARPVLCTYPSVFLPSEAEAARLRFKGRGLLAGTLKRIPLAYQAMYAGHRAYDAQLRETARAEGVDLIDLYTLVPQVPALYVDYIHHDDAGLQVVAGRVAQHIVKAGWLDEAGAGAPQRQE